MARDRSVPVVLGGIAKMFHESISKTAFCFPDVKLVTFGTGDSINKVP